MRDLIDILTREISIAGFGVPVIVLAFAALVVISAVTRNSWWAIGGACATLLFTFLLPALEQI